MGFVKLLKTNAYFKRFQTKYRRRREGLTDYYARKRLIIQDKDKYNTPKYRLVARATNKRIIAQIIYATLQHDSVLCAADSFELRKYGLTAGLASYASAYATGLLLARRLLKQIGLDTVYVGQVKVDGSYFNVEDGDIAEKKPFKAVLDTGLVSTSTGNRVFGVLKGACDGGINVPHSETRFPGNVEGAEGEASKYHPEKHRDRIFGKHIDVYMKYLKEAGAEGYQKQFSKWDVALKASKADSVEKLFTKIHAEIRKNPDRSAAKENKTPKREHTKYYPHKLTPQARKLNVQKRFQIAATQQ